MSVEREANSEASHALSFSADVFHTRGYRGAHPEAPGYML
jgi:hypothetical protein